MARNTCSASCVSKRDRWHHPFPRRYTCSLFLFFQVWRSGCIDTAIQAVWFDTTLTNVLSLLNKSAILLPHNFLSYSLKCQLDTYQRFLINSKHFLSEKLMVAFCSSEWRDIKCTFSAHLTSRTPLSAF